MAIRPAPVRELQFVDNRLLYQLPSRHLSPLDLLWLVYALTAAIVIWRAWCDIARRRRAHRSGIAQLDGMDGRSFVHYLAYLFRQLGFHVQTAKGFGQSDVDLILTKPGIRCAVQGKRWDTQVGPDAVREAIVARDYHYCHMALLVTNTTFTMAAKELAQQTGVELWDRQELISSMSAMQRRLSVAAHGGRQKAHTSLEPRKNLAPEPGGDRN